MTNTYKGPKEPVRKGASDAFKLPSLVDGKRIPYRPPVAQCTGTPKETTGFAK